MNRKRGPRGIAPLVALPGIGTRQSLRRVLDGQDTIAEGKLAAKRKLHERTRAYVGDDLKMIRLAANDATKCDRPVEGALRGFGMIECNRHGKRDFEGTGHFDAIKRSPRFCEGHLCTF